MTTPYETIQLENNVRAEIYHDDDCQESPRDWDNLGTMVCWHRDYDLGDENDFDNPTEFKEWLKDNPAIVLPLFLYDHSGISMSTSREYPFNCPWDSGQVGYIYLTLERARKEYSCKRISKQLRNRIVSYLKGEVKTYNQYLTGDIYGFKTVCNECETEIDSCWGFYGSDTKDNGMTEHWSGTECSNCAAMDKRIEKVMEY